MPINEISFIGNKILVVMNDHCAMFKHGAPTNHDLNKISIFVVRDFYQVPPVKAVPYLKEARTNISLSV